MDERARTLRVRVPQGNKQARRRKSAWLKRLEVQKQDSRGSFILCFWSLLCTFCGARAGSGATDPEDTGLFFVEALGRLSSPGQSGPIMGKSLKCWFS